MANAAQQEATLKPDGALRGSVHREESGKGGAMRSNTTTAGESKRQMEVGGGGGASRGSNLLGGRGAEAG